MPLSWSLDHAGPMARTVVDAAVLLGCLAGQDAGDVATEPSVGKHHTDYTQFLDPRGLNGARIGVVRSLFGGHPGVAKLMEEAIAEMKRLGAEVIDPADFSSKEKLDEHEFEVLLYDFKTDLNAYLSRLASNVQVRSLQDVIEFNGRNRDAEMPWFGQEIMLKAQEKGPLTSYREDDEQSFIK